MKTHRHIQRVTLTLSQLTAINEAAADGDFIKIISGETLDKIKAGTVAPAFRCALPKKQQRAMGFLPPVEKAA